MNQWANLKRRLDRLGRRLAEKFNVGNAPAAKRLDRVDDVAVRLAADEIKRAADRIRIAAEAATRKARALEAEKKLRRR
jgi:hypothetical protein